MYFQSREHKNSVSAFSFYSAIIDSYKLIDERLSVKENIMELIASPGARLENEVEMYLRSEIAKINNVNEVFEALAKGFSKFHDLLSQSHVSSGPTLIDVLKRLIKMEVVQKEAPINDEKNKRKSGYHIIDNLSLFYYRYIYRFSSQLSVMDPEVFYARYIEHDFETDYVPHLFESICKQYLIRQNRSGKLAIPFEKIGKYYYDDPITRTNGEFDIVTKDPEGYIFYEAKFRKAPLTQSMIEQEIEQVKAARLDCYRYGFFSRSGFESEPSDDMIFITLDDLYS